MAARKPSSPYHQVGDAKGRIESVPPKPVHTPPRPDPSPEELAERVLQAKREELAAMDAELERKREENERLERRRHDTDPPKSSGDPDKQLGRAVRTLAKQGAGVLATALLGAVMAVWARPAAAPEKVAQVQSDHKTTKDETDRRLKLCEDQLGAQQAINESGQDWIALIADKLGIDPAAPEAGKRVPATIELVSQKLDANSKSPPRFKAVKPLPPVPNKP